MLYHKLHLKVASVAKSAGVDDRERLWFKKDKSKAPLLALANNCIGSDSTVSLARTESTPRKGGGDIFYPSCFNPPLLWRLS